MEFSYWERNHLLLECEHIVVGAGIVGAFTALKLRELYPDSSICILEKNLARFLRTILLRSFARSG